MTGPQIVLAIIFAAVIILAVIGVAAWMIRTGCVEGSASLRIVPPWKRKAPEKRERPVAAAPEPATVEAPVTLERRQAS